MAAVGKKVVIPPPVIKKPDIAVKKPLIPVSPAAGVKKPGAAIYPKKPGDGGAMKPPKPIPLSKKLPGEDPGPAAKKDFVKPAPKPVALGKAGAAAAAPKKGVYGGKVSAKKDNLPNSVGKEANPAAPKGVAGAKTVAKKAADPKAKAGASDKKEAASAKGSSGWGFFSRLFRRKPQRPVETAKSAEKKPPPKFEAVKPRKMVGKKFGPAGAGDSKFQPRFGQGPAPSPSPAAKELPKTGTTPPLKKASEVAASPPAAPKVLAGLPPLKKPASEAAVPAKGPAVLALAPKKPLPTIQPKKLPGAPLLDKKIEVKKVEIVPKKPLAAPDEAAESLKKPAAAPAPKPEPAEKKSLVAKKSLAPKGDGQAKEEGKRPSVPGLLKQRGDGLKAGPAPKRTLAELLGQTAAKAPSGDDSPIDDSLSVKVKSYFEQNPESIPQDDETLKAAEVSQNLITQVTQAVGASPSDQEAVKKAIKLAFNCDIASRRLRDFLNARWTGSRAELIEGKLGPEPVAKEVLKDNPKVLEARDWIALAQDIKASAVAVHNALESLKNDKAIAYKDLIAGPFGDAAKFGSLANPIISSIQAKQETAALSSRNLLIELQSVAAHHQAVADLRTYLENEPEVSRAIIDAPKFKEKPKATAAKPTAASTTRAFAGGGAGARTVAAGAAPAGVGAAGPAFMGFRGFVAKRQGLGARRADTPESLKAHGDKLFTDAMSKIAAALGDKYSYAILAGAAHELETQLTIPKGTCWLADILLPMEKEGDIFSHHRVLSYMFGFFDSTSYVRFRECSKLTYRAVEMDLAKRLYRLPLQAQQERTDIGYFYQIVSFFCRVAARLSPLNRLRYGLTVNALKAAEWMVPVTPDAMRSSLFVSLDRLPHDMISLREAEKPLPHLWKKSQSKGDSIGKATSAEINLADFIWEYRQRVTVNRDEIVWQQPVDELDVGAVCALLQQATPASMMHEWRRQ
ncbi:hypothetical protein BESB_013970 [Besnoitia besnoiti]|uniref:Uncharacterized protein n=1 Tax=Besnoitia besnoiti TaxID=94643 RepID=A0A2A9M493_BESBE|nr:hypothetical protein BESB_013970 [Besnoitia besnoiti]PFH32785.1 hypothetical protein BESB_013970 [Besnoitia besnoiti]